MILSSKFVLKIPTGKLVHPKRGVIVVTMDTKAVNLISYCQTRLCVALFELLSPLKVSQFPQNCSETARLGP